MENLQRVLTSFSSSLQSNKLDGSIVKEIAAFLKADQSSIMLFDPAERSEAKTYIRESGSNKLKLDHFLHEMLAGWIIENRKQLRTDDLSFLLDSKIIERRYGSISSLMVTPIISNSNLQGMLTLIRVDNKSPFSQSEAELIAVLTDMLAHLIHMSNLHQQVFQENVRLKEELKGRYTFEGLVGNSVEMKQVYELLERVILTDALVLIEGESGTGKELVAKLIHYTGPRQDKPFVAVDCGALPATLLEAELFGYVKGAFTGAEQNKNGLFDVADEGTIFLDEISNMPLEIQGKFLRVIQEREFRPVGSTSVKKVDVRIIAAGSGGLRRQVDSGRLREDLYYRLNVVTLELPPLRERKGDILLLAQHFLGQLTAKHSKQAKRFTAEAAACLEAYPWPGNVRELENAVERMVVLAQDNLESLPPTLLPPAILEPAPAHGVIAGEGQGATDIKSRMERFERKVLLNSLERNNWNKSAAARELGTTEHYVRNKMKKYGIKRPV